MDEASNEHDGRPKGWRRLLRPKNIVLVPVGIVAILFGIFVLLGATSFLSQLTGVEQGVSVDSVQVPSLGGVYDRVDVEGMRTAPVVDSVDTPPFATEAYEAREYHATIRTRHKDEVCDVVEGWRMYSYVTFEHMTRSNTACHYRFKVERDRAQQILEAVLALDPTHVQENATLMRERILQHESERDILAGQDEHLERMLAEVTRLYDQLMTTSANTGDTSMLTKAIDDRLRYMRSLAEDRVRLARQIDALDRRGSELMERIENVTFTINVEERRFVNGTQLKDSWMSRVKSFITDANKIAQDLTIGLILTLLVFLKYALHIVLIIVIGFLIAVPLWRAGRRFLRNE